MVLNFMGKGKKGGSHGSGEAGDRSKESTSTRPLPKLSEEMQSMLNSPEGQWDDKEEQEENAQGNIKLAPSLNK